MTAFSCGNPPSVVLVHDDATVAESVRAACVTRSLCVDRYSNAEEFLQDDIPNRPWCLVLDIILPEMNGFKLLDVLTSRGVKTSTIVLTAYGNLTICAQAFKRGIADFIEVPFGAHALVESIEAAIQSNAVSRKTAARTEHVLSRLESLTDRQQQVLSSIVAGHSIKQIAIEFDVSQQTIARHRASIFRTFGVANEVGLMRILCNAGCLNESWAVNPQFPCP